MLTHYGEVWCVNCVNAIRGYSLKMHRLEVLEEKQERRRNVRCVKHSIINSNSGFIENADALNSNFVQGVLQGSA